MRNDLLEWMAGATILLLIATTGYAQLAEDSIAGVWLFEEGKGKVAKDTSGNDNHAEFGSGAPKWVAGKYGQGIQLNGEDEWLTIPTEKGKVAEELDFKESTSFSIHAWVFPDGAVCLLPYAFVRILLRITEFYSIDSEFFPEPRQVGYPLKPIEESLPHDCFRPFGNN